MSLLLALQPGNVYGTLGSGGITTGSAAAIAKVKTPAIASAGIATGGNGNAVKGKNFAGSGGIKTAGAASFRRTKAYAMSGGAQFAGGAALIKYRSYIVASGGVTLAGGAGVAKTKVNVGTGGITTGGGAGLSRNLEYLSLANFLLTGSAGLAKVKTLPIGSSPTGDMVFSGFGTYETAITDPLITLTPTRRRLVTQ